jgi:RNA polymerase II subunit A-like phosphatase
MALSLFELRVYTAGTRDYAEQITIMLARHLAGAKHDQVDLDNLRYRVAKAHADLERVKAKDGEADAKEEETNDQKTESTDRKRKRVTFGEPASAQKSDYITESQVAELRSELEEAERLEVKAYEMRMRLFGSRVVSRTDVGDLGRDVKSLKRIFPCGGTMAVVVDDREDVWANAGDVTKRKGEPPENVLLVRPYHWTPFLGFADVNNAAGADLSNAFSENGNNSSSDVETDEQLLWTSDILKRLHERFYAAEGEQTVVEILRQMRHEVLAGGNIVLSGLVPLHKQNLSIDVPRPPFVRYVECLGATLMTSVTNATTHVVAAKDGTDKILTARKIRGCFIVKPSWLMECFWTLKRCDERNHLLGLASQGSQVQPMSNARVGSGSSTSEDDEDDDLAAEFESEMEAWL